MSAVVEEKRRVGNPEWNFVLPYDEARRIVKNQKFKTMKDYMEWVNLENPPGLSKNPYQIYTRRGEWISTAHYLGKIEVVKVAEDVDVPAMPPHKLFKLKSIIRQIFNLRD